MPDSFPVIAPNANNSKQGFIFKGAEYSPTFRRDYLRTKLFDWRICQFALTWIKRRIEGLSLDLVEGVEFNFVEHFANRRIFSEFHHIPRNILEGPSV